MIQLHPRDEAELMWFFSHGLSAFERSTMGSMLDRAELFAVAAPGDGYAAVRNALGQVIGHTATFAYDAQPTAELRAPSGYVPDDSVLARYAVVSRRLMKLERREPIAVTVFEAYYGDVGARWALSPRPGRIAALYHLTASGQRLLDAAADDRRKQNQPELGVSPPMRMANEIDAKQTERRRVGLMRAERQACELLLSARAAWNVVKSEIRGGRAA